ncbi:MAG TPA: pepsin/retropepsin-like aspartic protease family protein [Rhizomicrobium sp.]|nr:pepsin/retropepsin-like aspartic protease family protein [Rhizomicrobium sp.]
MIARAAFAAVLLFASAASAQDCKLRAVASLRTEAGPDNLLLVPASVNGQQVLMLFDTGATRGILDAGFAQSLGLPANRIPAAQPSFAVPRHPLLSFQTAPSMQFFTANGTRLNRYTVAPSFDLGGVHGTDVRFMLAGFADPNIPPLKGILGSDRFRDYDVELDPRARLVNLYSQDHCEGHVVYWADAYSDIPIGLSQDGEIRLIMTLDGQELDTVLDTGASNTTLSLQAAHNVFGLDTDSPGVEKQSGEGRDGVYRTRFKSLVAGGVAIANPQIVLVRDALADRLKQEEIDAHHLMPDTRRTPQLILGMDILRQLHVYIAYREKKLYVTAAAAGMPGH